MILKETFVSALKALTANKIRSALTMLGVIIGVFSVVALLSLGKGLQNYISDEFDALGSNLLFISPGSGDFTGDPAEAYGANKLDEKHLKLIELHASDHVVATSPYIVAGEMAEYKSKSYFSEISGVSFDSLTIVNYEIELGRMFTQAEQNGKAKVAVLGKRIVDELYAGNNPVGQKIKIRDKNYEVIGTFAEKGSNYDDQILVPYTTAQDHLEIANLSSIVAKIDSPDNTNVAMRQIEIALLRDMDEDDFSILSAADILETIQSVLQFVTLGLGALAGISLLVGGIGIMNIMLVSITERTREIGLRKAVGATPNIIALQFLVESVAISVTGGAVGIFFGFLMTIIAQQFIRAEITPGALLIALGFSTAVGVLFGTYPAILASKKDPIVALRYE